MASPMGAAIVAGVALSPVAVTLAAGLGGLGLAALGAAKDARAMHGVLSPLRAEVADFQKSLKPQVLTLFGDGAGIAGNALKQLQPVAAATAKGLHGVLGGIGAEFKSGEFQHFFQFMAQTAQPDIQLLGKTFIDLAADIPPVLETLQPVASGLLKITDAVASLPGVLDKVKQKTGANQPGFWGGTGLDRIREFITWGGKNIPGGNKSISDLIGLTGRANATVPATGVAIAATGASAAAAAPKIGTLAGDMATLNATVGSGNSVLAAYSDLWDKFVGKSVSDQQAVLSLKQAFEGYNSAVTQSGRKSTTAQQAFLSIFTTLGSGLDTLHKNRASIADINSLYDTTIARLSALHGLTPQQQADVQGVTKDYLAWAGSVDRLSGNAVNAATQIKNTLLAQLGFAHTLTPQVSGDMSTLANAILKTGDRSRATAIDRAQLIKDFEKSGLTAIQAQQAAIDFQGQIDKLHGKTVKVDVTASGSGGISVGATGLQARIFKLAHLATGGVVPGGYSRADNHLALLRSGEGVLQPGAVAALGGPQFISQANARFGDVPVSHFAAGGVAGLPPWVGGQEGSVLGGWAGQDVASMLASVIAALKATAAASGSFTPGAPATGSAAAAQAFARSILPAGWSWPDLRALWNRESGWNAYAVNPSSGAYGIPQALGHGHPYNLGDYANQVRWGISYIAGRYGNSQNAWAHEVAFNWYDKGGMLPTGLSLAYNGTGRPEPVIPAARLGRGPASVTIVIENHGIIGSQAEADRFIKSAVDRLATDGQLAYALRHSPSAA